MNETRTGSLNPDDAKLKGFFLDDADITIESVRYVNYDFQGNAKQPRLCLRLTIEGATYPEYLPIGWPSDYAPSPDGKRAVSVSDKAGKFRATDPGMRFITSAVECGFPKEKIGDDASVFDGLSCHVTRVPDENYKPKPGAPPPKRVPSVLLVTKILALPGEKPPAGEGENHRSGRAVNGPETPLAIKTRAAILHLGEVGKPLHRRDLFQGLMKSLASDPDLNQVVNLAYSDVFLSQPGQPWKYDSAADTITIEVPF
jgi:hypothetical protein